MELNEGDFILIAVRNKSEERYSISGEITILREMINLDGSTAKMIWLKDSDVIQHDFHNGEKE